MRGMGIFYIGRRACGEGSWGLSAPKPLTKGTASPWNLHIKNCPIAGQFFKFYCDAPHRPCQALREGYHSLQIGISPSLAVKSTLGSSSRVSMPKCCRNLSVVL